MDGDLSYCLDCSVSFIVFDCDCFRFLYFVFVIFFVSAMGKGMLHAS